MRRLGRALVVGLLLLSLTSVGAGTAADAAPAFVDVPAASAHSDAIAALADAGVTAGCADGRYCPRGPVTRDQMATFLARALQLDTTAGASRFADVPVSSTHAGAIEALAAAGVTSGCAEGRYCPRQPVTRDQMASFLVRAFGLPGAGSPPFSDVARGSTHADAIAALAEAGVTGGCGDDRYCPRRPVTRDQMASFLARALGLVGPLGPSEPPPSTGSAPDDAVVAFVHEPFSGCAGPCAEETAIWTVRADGGEATAVTTPDGAADRLPRWSPDGSALAFVRVPRGATAGEVYAVDVRDGRTTAARRVTSTGAAHGGRGCHGQAMSPVWSPDARRLAVTCAADDAPGAASTVYVVGTDGAGQFALPTGAATAARPTWAPDGDRLAFTRTDLTRTYGAAGRTAVWVADVGPSGAASLRPLVSGDVAADHARWSPRGDRIAFVSTDPRTLRPTLGVVAARGGTPATVYAAPANQTVQLYDLAWSPAGGHLAFPVGDGLTRSVVHVVSAGGGRATAVSPTDALAFAPAWSPSSHLAFDVVSPAGAGAEAHQLVTAAADGTGRRAVHVTGAYAYDAQWRPGG